MHDRRPADEHGRSLDPDDILPLVYGWMRALGNDGQAEDLAVDAAARYLLGHGPDWLQRRDDRWRLSYLTVRVVLESHGSLEAPS